MGPLYWSALLYIYNIITFKFNVTTLHKDVKPKSIHYSITRNCFGLKVKRSACHHARAVDNLIRVTWILNQWSMAHGDAV